jgi:CHAT domain-containing protein
MLYQILIDPIANIIKNKSELLIIPYGQLYYIPFETLVCKHKNNTHSPDCTYLINRYIVKYHYSATLWYHDIKNKRARLNQNKYLFEFTGFAPLCLDEANEKEFDYSQIKEQYDSAQESTEYVAPLPFSGQEVNSICTLFKAIGKNANQYILENATEHMFKTSVSNSKYIHVATHGFINKLEPSFSGLLFYDYLPRHQNISPGKFNRIVEQNDGILYLNELYNLDINAELAVISACEGGNGKFENSEGIISLARGLIYSGVDNIIISLFKIPDKHTKDLMIYFYKKVISGYTFAEALRMAKLHIIESRNSFPKIWGGFIIIGN